MSADYDECKGGLGPCGSADAAGRCNNTAGSYKCDCNSGYHFNLGYCQGEP